ncbi:hypothetical protein [Roseateles sp. P5_E7]
MPLLTIATALSACSRTEPPPAAPPVQAAPAMAAASTSEDAGPWVGRWQGPEGTFLDIAGGPGTYRVTVQNLDGPRSFDAKAGSATLTFVRDGVIETVRPGNGVDTGMKWLADKRDCLIVKAGEGYCRS